MIRKVYDRYDKYIDKLQKCFDTLDEIETQMEEEVKEQSNVDKELSDYLHIIEDDKPIRNHKAFINKIRSARKRRRELLILVQVLHKLKQNSLKMNNSSNRKMLIAELRKTVKANKMEYKYRVIEGGEINEDIYKSTDDEQE